MTYSCLVIISNNNDLKFGFARDQKIFWRYRRHILRLMTHSYIVITLAISTLRLIQLALSGTLSLEVTNTPGTAKVLGSNLIRACFFFKRETFRSKKIVGLLCICLFFVEYAMDSKGSGFESDQGLFFFSNGKYSVLKKFSAYYLSAYFLSLFFDVAFSVWFNPTI